MKINLNVKDRITVISMLPTNGSILEISIAIDIVKEVKFTEEERISLKYSEKDNKIYWDRTKEEDREFNFSIEQISLLKECVKKLDDTKKVDMNSIETCIKIKSL